MNVNPTSYNVHADTSRILTRSEVGELHQRAHEENWRTHASHQNHLDDNGAGTHLLDMHELLYHQQE